MFNTATRLKFVAPSYLRLNHSPRLVMVLCAMIYAEMKTGGSTVLVLVIRTALAMLCMCADRGTLKV